MKIGVNGNDLFCCFEGKYVWVAFALTNNLK